MIAQRHVNPAASLAVSTAAAGTVATFMLTN
jgi:hypothetical protein